MHKDVKIRFYLPHFDLDKFIWATSKDNRIEYSFRSSYSDVLNCVSKVLTILIRLYEIMYYSLFNSYKYFLFSIVWKQITFTDCYNNLSVVSFKNSILIICGDHFYWWINIIRQMKTRHPRVYTSLLFWSRHRNQLERVVSTQARMALVDTIMDVKCSKMLYICY